MSFRTNPDRILENIDRARDRESEDRLFDRQAIGKDLDTDVPDLDATGPERLKRVFGSVERAYRNAAKSEELGKLASRFQAVGDIPRHHARGDISVSIHYLDHDRPDDQGVVPFEIVPDDLEEARKSTKTSRADLNAMRVLRAELRDGTMTALKKLEPRVRDSIRARADMGHVQVQVTVDLRPAS